jgi:photosystem II stability/assembly factor-like uncharacterized protein
VRARANEASWRCNARARRIGARASVCLLISLGAVVNVSIGAPGSSSGDFRDPLDTPAQATRFASATQTSAIARAGSRLVAVGAQGLIVLSDDDGQTWRQVASPVSSDLVAVRFVSAGRGWASGHDGVILATTDGGEHWARQIDGRMAADLLKAHLGKLAARGDAAAARLLKGVTLNYQNGPEVPMLDLWFENEQVGWAVGSFGTILGTRDGGQTWESWIEKVDSDKMLHYNAVGEVGGNVYLASEQGTVFRLDRKRDRFVAIATGYNGSFFGVVGTQAYIIAYGIGGSAYRSRDNGTSWQRLSTGVHGSITGACVLDDGRLLLVSQDGHLIMSRDEGDTFQRVAISRPDLFTGVAPAGPNRVVLTGLGGVRRVNLQ